MQTHITYVCVYILVFWMSVIDLVKGQANTHINLLFVLPQGLVVPVDEEHPSHLILGVLLTLRYLMPLLQQQVNTTSLKGSFGVMRKEADVQPTPEQLIQVKTVCVHVCITEDYTILYEGMIHIRYIIWSVDSIKVWFDYKIIVWPLDTHLSYTLYSTPRRRAQRAIGD